MKEYQRQKAIEEATKKIKELEQLNDKYDELEKQKQNPAVIAYLKLLKDISLLEEKYKYIQNKEDIIKDTFYNVCQQQKCSHPIWIYEASEYLKLHKFEESNEEENEEEYEYEEEDYIEDEYKRIEEQFDEFVEKLSENYESNESNFSYEFANNYYTCLECGVNACIFDWEEFERKHFVLKNQNEFVNISYYIKLYYQLLYTNTVKEAQKIVIEEFEKNKQGSKTKILKKEGN